MFPGGAGAMNHSLLYGIGKGGIRDPEEEKEEPEVVEYVKAPWYWRLLGVTYVVKRRVEDDS